MLCFSDLFAAATSVKSFIVSDKPLSAVQRRAFLFAGLRFIVEGDLPFSVWSQPAFWRMIHSLNPTVKTMTRQGAMKYIPKFFKTVQLEVSRRFFQRDRVEFSATADSSSALHQRAFGTVTIHVIEPSSDEHIGPESTWKLISITLGAHAFPVSSVQRT